MEFLQNIFSPTRIEKPLQYFGYPNVEITDLSPSQSTPLFYGARRPRRLSEDSTGALTPPTINSISNRITRADGSNATNGPYQKPLGLSNHGNSCFLNALVQAFVASDRFYDHLLELYLLNKDDDDDGIEELDDDNPLSMLASPCTTKHNVASSSAVTRPEPLCDRCLYCALIHLFVALRYEGSSQATVDSLTKSVIGMLPRMPVFALTPYRQEDAHELFINLVELLRRSTCQLFGKQSSITSNVVPSSSSNNSKKDSNSMASVLVGKTCSRVECQSCQNITSTIEDCSDLSLDISHCSSLWSAMAEYFR